jgi:dihydroorotase
MRIVIQGGRVIDPGRLDAVADIFIEDDKISEVVLRSETEPANKAVGRRPDIRAIDATGKIVCPGFIDMHVHLREPGHEYKETIETGCRAAAWGGFTAVCAMPNTHPVNDNARVTAFIMEKAARANTARVYPVGAISEGLEGRRLCDFAQLKAGGAIAVSDDGKPVADERLMLEALRAARENDLRVISHCENPELTADGVMNAGPVALQMGLTGIPNTSESKMVARDVALSELTGIPIHIAHVSKAESVQTIREAKARGVSVTAETAPHYFMLTDAAVKAYGTRAKMNPPLGSDKDRAAIRDGLRDGTIEVIATDHAPQSSLEKDVPFAEAPNGVVGMETAVSLGLKLVQEGVISITKLVEKMATGPARILGLEKNLQPGRDADITIIDPAVPYVVDVSKFQSLGKNCPFDGWQLNGRPVLTMVAGRVVFGEKMVQLMSGNGPGEKIP